MTRVFVVDDHAVLADALAALLGREAGITVVGVANDGSTALAGVTQTMPDVVLMDQYLPDTTGVELTSVLRHELPDLVVLMLTSDESDETMLAAIEAGASGYLLKDEPAGNVVAAVRRAASGATLIPASVVQRLLAVRREQDAARSRAERAIPALTPREKTVLTLMERGLTARAVAEELGISWDTARDHIQNVIEKLDAHSKPEAVFRARQLGLLAADSPTAADSGGRVARHDRQ